MKFSWSWNYMIKVTWQKSCRVIWIWILFLLFSGGPADWVGVLCDPGLRRSDSGRWRLVHTAHVLLLLQEEPAERTDGLPEERLSGSVLLHGLPHHLAAGR